MNEVEKMYENAGINQVCNTCELRGFKRLCPTKELCVRTNPPFTAEKQLELIKFLFNHNVYYDVDTKGNYWFHISDDCYTYYYNKFEIALANIINEMWQGLTEEEKQQVKGILE